MILFLSHRACAQRIYTPTHSHPPHRVRRLPLSPLATHNQAPRPARNITAPIRFRPPFARNGTRRLGGNDTYRTGRPTRRPHDMRLPRLPGWSCSARFARDGGGIYTRGDCCAALGKGRRDSSEMEESYLGLCGGGALRWIL